MASLIQLANQLEDLKRQQIMVEEAMKKETEKIESNPDIDRYETLVNEIESELRSGIVGSRRDRHAETRREIGLKIQPFLHFILKIVKTQHLKIHDLQTKHSLHINTASMVMNNLDILKKLDERLRALENSN
jgi:hypothetical protein